MAHFAKLDSNNIVTDIIVVNNDILIKADGTESELKGKKFLNSLLGNSTWVQTSYNSNFRKHFARIGYKYDSVRDAFIPPQPYPSWVLNENTLIYEAPIEAPAVSGSTPVEYRWNENDEQWDLIS